MVKRVEAVIFDWAGTVVDYGCIAPAATFQWLFNQWGVPLSMDVIRGPMGLHKRDHIKALLTDPAIAERWAEAWGEFPTEGDIDAMYAQFVPAQLEAIRTHAELIPGVVEVVKELRKEGIKIGSCTGYTREMMDVLQPLAAEQGYEPDFIMCASEVPQGRPAPWMIFRNMEALGVLSTTKVLKVGDTVSDMQEGCNAGVWTAGVVHSSSLVGLPYEAATEADTTVVVKTLVEAGAHFTFPTIQDIPQACEMITLLLEKGYRGDVDTRIA